MNNKKSLSRKTLVLSNIEDVEILERLDATPWVLCINGKKGQHFDNIYQKTIDTAIGEISIRKALCLSCDTVVFASYMVTNDLWSHIILSEYFPDLQDISYEDYLSLTWGKRHGMLCLECLDNLKIKHLGTRLSKDDFPDLPINKEVLFLLSLN